MAAYIALLLIASLSFASAQQEPLASPLLEQLNAAGYSGFVRLLEMADLVPELDSHMQSSETTLFVPSNEALMYKISPALLAYLKAPTNKELLRQVLRFHIVTERISAFKWDGSHKTIEGSPAVLRMDALSFYVSNVAVKQYNAIILEDSVVHSIRGLLIPPTLETALGSIEMHSDDEEEGRRILQGGAASAPPPFLPPPEPPVFVPAPVPAPAPPPPRGPNAPMKSAGRYVAAILPSLAGALAFCLLF